MSTIKLKRYYLGIACTYHDPAIAILSDSGEVLFAEATERFLQNKRSMTYTADDMFRINNLLGQHCPDVEELRISFSWSKRYINRFVTAGGITTYGVLFKAIQPFIKDLPSSFLAAYNFKWVNETQKAVFSNLGSNTERYLMSTSKGIKIKKSYIAHHKSHANYACSASNFEEGICLVVDGHGERGPVSIFHYDMKDVRLLKEQMNSASIGFLYDTLTQLCGFDPLKGEQGKTMGLAAYGSIDSSLYSLLEKALVVDNLQLRFKSYLTFRSFLIELYKNFIPKNEDDKRNIARTAQEYFEKIILELIGNVANTGVSKNLIYTGGCALNSTLNGKLFDGTGFKNVYIPPAPGDDGNAIGCALEDFSKDNPDAKSPNVSSPYLGSQISQATIRNAAMYNRGCSSMEMDDLIDTISRKLSQGKIVGWIQDKAEFGPRALGNRSIIADPRNPSMKDKINDRVKFRENFRPFAPAILNEYGPEYFVNYRESRYMELTLKFKEEVVSKIPAVVHADNSGRVQSVKYEWNPRFHKLLTSFYNLTGVPILLNTSLNIMGKPMVHSLEDAIGIFFTTGLDVLVFDNYVIEK